MPAHGGGSVYLVVSNWPHLEFESKDINLSLDK